MSNGPDDLVWNHSSTHTQGELPVRERLSRLAEFLPIFENPEFAFGGWVHPLPNPDGTVSPPWLEWSPAARRFVQAAYDLGFVATDFDWPEWAKSDECQAFVNDPQLIADATVDQLVQLLTSSIRSDRVAEGTLQGLFESGLLTAILRRAAALHAAAVG